jgi:hypothetical protein
MPTQTYLGNKEEDIGTAAVRGTAGQTAYIGGHGELTAAELAIAETDGMEFVLGPSVSPGAPNVSAMTITEEASGLLSAGAYKWVVTYVTAKGETLASVEVGATLAASKQAKLANIPIGPSGTIERKIYRTKAAGATGTEKLVSAIGNNTATTFVDNVADASLTTSIPTEDTSANGTAAANAKRKFKNFHNGE